MDLEAEMVILMMMLMDPLKSVALSVHSPQNVMVRSIWVTEKFHGVRNLMCGENQCELNLFLIILMLLCVVSRWDEASS